MIDLNPQCRKGIRDMSGVRKELIARLAAEVPALLPAGGHYAVATDTRFVLLPGITSARTRFDLAILSRTSQGQLEPVSLRAGMPIFGLNVVTLDTLEHDLIEVPNLLSRSTVRNYVLFDPTGEVLKPRIQAYAVKDGGLEVARTAATGRYSHRLGFQLDLIGDALAVLSAPEVRVRFFTGGVPE